MIAAITGAIFALLTGQPRLARDLWGARHMSPSDAAKMMIQRGKDDEGVTEPDERHGWRYDPDWRYFVRGLSGAQEFATRESVEASREWAESPMGLGLSVADVAWLIEHPTPGCYEHAG